jgi:hypothetical protein
LVTGHFAVSAAEVQQVTMGALLNEPTIIHHKDLIAAGHGAQTVADHNDGAFAF